MANFFSSFPSAEVKPANVNIGDMVNTLRGAQAYKSGEITLEQQTELNNEQRRIAEAMKQDPNLFMTDNRLDPEKFNKIIPQLAPRNQDKFLSTYNTLYKAQTDAAEAKRGLSQNYKNMIGSRYSVLGRMGVDDPNVYIAEGNLMKQEYPDIPELHRYIDAANTTFRMSGPGAHVPQMAIRGAQTLLTPAQQQEVFEPKVGTMNLGTDIMQTTTQQRPGGLAPTVTVGPQLGTAQVTPSQYYADTGRVDVNNQPIYRVISKTGQVLGEITVPGGVSPSQLPGGPAAPQPAAPQAVPGQPVPGTPVAPQPNLQPTPLPPVGATPLPPASIAPANAPVRIPPGETSETGRAYQDQTIGARSQVQPAGVALNNIRTVRQYLPLAQTGASSETIAKLQSVFGNVAGSKPEEFAAAARDIIEKNIADLALQKNSALGGKFAADLNAVQSSLSSAGKNPTAIAKVMDQLEPLMQHVQNYSLGLNRAIERSPNKIYAKPAFDNAMNEAFDIRALMMKNAFDNGGKPALDKFVKENNINVRDQQVLLQKLQRYGQLVRGEL